MGKEGTGGLFSQGGEANPFGGWAAGLRVAKSLRRPAPAMQIHREQSSPSQRGAWLPRGGWGRMPGQRCPRGSTLSPKGPQSPDPAKQPLPHPSSHRFLGSWPQYPLGRGRALTSPYSPPVHLWQRGLASRQRPLATCGVEARTGRVQRSLGNTDPKLLGLSGRLRVQSA